MPFTTTCNGFQCQNTGHLRCSHCKIVYYCSKECQKGNWKEHKTFCESPLKDKTDYKKINNGITKHITKECGEDKCKKKGEMSCSRCKEVSYCSKKCQTIHWKEHKKGCKSKNESTCTQVSKECGEETCKKTGGLNCSQCKSILYCSKDCQKKDWKRHKKNCGAGVSTDDGNDRHDDINNADVKDAIDHQIMQMVLGKTSSVASEYLRAYPKEIKHMRRIQYEETIYWQYMFQEKKQHNPFKERDFSSPESFQKRWGPCLSDSENLSKFLCTPGRKGGDIYERPSHPPFNNMFFQTMRNTSIANQVYEFGKTYVAFGFVDLFQLMWGSYVNNMMNNNRLIFYGFEQNRVTTVRSKLIYGIMKHFREQEISTLSILQIWFSSCWDDTTNQAFQRVLRDAFADVQKYDLEEEDVMLLKKWKTARITIMFAKEKFSKGLINPHFDDVWQMKLERDRVVFCRYLFTGCIFVDECNIVCGNPTMFTESNGQSIMTGELFFKAVDLLAVGFNRTIIMSDSLFETISMLTQKTALGFRSFVNMGKIVCYLETKFVDPKDFKFASRIKSLQPYGIDWSNLPDYMEKKQFIKFARACSDEDTIHQLHFLNWIYYVYGACHVDWKDNQELCLEMYLNYKKFQKELPYDLHSASSNNMNWRGFFDGEIYINPLNELNLAIAMQFRQAFEDYFLSDENGKVLNRCKENICDGAKSNFFTQSSTMFRSVFTFNDDIVLIRMKGK